jgi:hypothetical protein
VHGCALAGGFDGVDVRRCASRPAGRSSPAGPALESQPDQRHDLAAAGHRPRPAMHLTLAADSIDADERADRARQPGDRAETLLAEAEAFAITSRSYRRVGVAWTSSFQQRSKRFEARLRSEAAWPNSRASVAGRANASGVPRAQARINTTAPTPAATGTGRRAGIGRPRRRGQPIAAGRMFWFMRNRLDGS